MRQKHRYARLACVMGMIVLAGACHRKKIIPPPPPPPPPPAKPPEPVCTLTAEPTTVDKGQSVTLSWTSQNATDLDLQPGPGKQQAQGSTSVTPQESTSYTFVASGPGGRTGCTARVTIAAAAPPPPSPVAGESGLDAFTNRAKDEYFD